VPYCYSPFPLEPALEQLLKAAGVHPAGLGDAGSKMSLLIYDSPHRVLALWQQLDSPQPSPALLLQGYRDLEQRAGTAHLISAWRLASLSAEHLQQWVLGQASCPAVAPALPEIDPIQAVVTRGLLDLSPEIMEIYLDLELQAELAGGEVDSDYPQRLSTSANGEALLTSWWSLHQHKEVQQLRLDAQELREEADLSLHQLQKTQSQFEELILRNQETESKLSWNRSKLKEVEEKFASSEAERERAATACSAAETIASDLKQQLQESQEEAELVLLQLHQVQESWKPFFWLTKILRPS
jgi:hypothetical protein